jgi:Leucine-rich repeat (LRR) protein
MKTINFTPKSKTVLLGLSLVISFLFLPFLSNSQSVAIKDSKFEKALVDLKLDKDGLNGSLRLSDVDTVTRLMISNKGITDLTGIEAFRNLKLLNCDSNLLSFIKFINLPYLVEVHCANNKFVGLDFSHNKSLKSLDCKNNQLTSLNISNDSSSKFVQFLATGNPNLRIICVDDKSFASVNFLDIDLGVIFNDINCKTGIIPDLIFETNLVKLNIDKNGLTGTIQYSDADNVLSLNLKNLGINDITGIGFFKSLKNFDCSGNNLKAFDLSALQDITNLNCFNNKLTSLDISKNERIERLICSFNELNTLLIDSNLSLRYINCEYNKLSLLNIEGLAGLDTLKCDNNQIIDLSLFGLNVTYLNCSNNKLSSINVVVP